MDEPGDLVPAGRLRVMQIIAFAQVMGVAVFAGIAIFMVQVNGKGQGLAPAQQQPIQSIVAAAMLAVLGPLSFIAPQAIRRPQLRRMAQGAPPQTTTAGPAYDAYVAALLGFYQTSMISGLAMVETAGFMCCIAYLLEGRTYVFALIAVALVLQIIRIPTAARLRAWMARQIDWLENERQRISG